MGAPEAKSDPQNTGPIEVFVKMSSWLPRAGQEGPKEVQEVPRASQERSGAAQDRSKSGPRVAKSGPRAAQDRPRNSPRGARSGPRGQRRPQRLPGGSTWANLGPTSANLEPFWAAQLRNPTEKMRYFQAIGRLPLEPRYLSLSCGPRLCKHAASSLHVRVNFSMWISTATDSRSVDR